MSHPIGEIVAGAVVVIVLGGTLLVLPQSAREVPSEELVLEVDAVETHRATPIGERTNAERVEDLERRLSALAAEHRKLNDQVKAIAREASPPNGQGGGS